MPVYIESINAYICLGSNQGPSERILQAALDGINLIPGCRVMSASAIYLSEPQGYRHQPWFKNQVLKIMADSSWTARTFLRQLLHLEHQLGRKRTELHYGPRLIDIDLLLFGEQTINEPDCILPHPRMLNRAFVLAPLFEIEPSLTVQGCTIKAALAKLPWRMEGIKIYQELEDD